MNQQCTSCRKFLTAKPKRCAKCGTVLCDQCIQPDGRGPECQPTNAGPIAATTPPDYPRRSIGPRPR